MKNQRGESIRQFIGMIAIAAFLLLGGVGGCMWGYPKYKVYTQEMDGKAVLAQATSSRRVAVEEAQALKDSAKFKAEAEVIRAQGVADANRIVAEGLGGAEGYLRYLAIDAMKAQASSPNSSTIYVATEAGIPITEATRFNKPSTTE